MERHSISHTPGQWLFIILFFSAHLSVSYLFADLYPFSSMPMFSSNQREILRFRVTTPEDETLPSGWFGLDSRDVANNSARLGLTVPPSLCDDFSAFLRQDERNRERVIRESITKGLTDPYVAYKVNEAVKNLPRELLVTFEKLSVEPSDLRVKHIKVGEWKIVL